MDVDSLARRLHHDGVCVIDAPPSYTSEQKNVDAYRAAAASIIDSTTRLTSIARAAGLRDDAIDCREICQRHTYRYDLRLSNTTKRGTVEQIVLADAQKLAEPVLVACERLRGASGAIDLDYSGAVSSFPGADTQGWHVDGELEGLYTLFVPLVDITAENGGTEFRPGTHMDERVDRASVIATPRVGSVVLFDYRILHRGLANSSKYPRPIMYAVYARRGVEDTDNFPTITMDELVSGPL